MHEAYQLAGRKAKERSDKAKKPLYPLSRELVRNLSERGGSKKLRSYWEKTSNLLCEERVRKVQFTRLNLKSMPYQANGT